jgi:hypothetical protein
MMGAIAALQLEIAKQLAMLKQNSQQWPAAAWTGVTLANAGADPSTESSLFFRSTGALDPLVFLPMHLAMFHLAVRILPAKRFIYPIFLVHAILFFAAEHYTKELPTLGAATPIFAVTQFGTYPYIFYCAFKKTTGPKWPVWLAIAFFLISIPLLKELGVPKDDLADQMEANFDPHYTVWHVAVHAVFVITWGVAGYSVPWSADWPVNKTVVKKTAMAPRSPKHTTLSPSAKRAFTAGWPKPAVKAD